MDFTSPPAVIEGFQRIVEHGTFGYTWCFDEFYDAVMAFQRTRHQVEVEKSWLTLTYGTVPRCITRSRRSARLAIA
jgi:cystathionine beta-lyase